MRTVRASDEADALGALFATPPAVPVATPVVAPAAAPSAPVLAPVRLVVVLLASVLATLAIEPLVGRLASAGPTGSLAVASMLLAAIALAAAWAARVPIAPLRASAGTIAIGAGQGIAGLCWCGIVLALSGRLTVGAATGRPGPALLVGAAVLLAQVAGEELFFRGWVQAALMRMAPPWAAVALAAATFSGLHLVGGARSPLALIDILLAGIWLGLLAWRLGLATAIAAHWGWNAAEMLGLGVYPNPGVGPWGALWDRDIAGPPVWGGGEEGLNASVVATFVFAGLALAAAAARRQDA